MAAQPDSWNSSLVLAEEGDAGSLSHPPAAPHLRKVDSAESMSSAAAARLRKINSGCLEVGHEDGIGGVPSMTESFIVRPHLNFKQNVAQIVNKRQIGLIMASAAISVILSFTVLADVTFVGNEPSETVPQWKPLFVLNLLIGFVVLVMGGANAESSLVGLSSLAVVTGCLDVHKLFAGAGSGAVTSLALLFPIAKALDETGWPEIAIGKFLGSPKSMMSGVLRMFFGVALLSGIFNNTPIVATMIPVLMTWCQRLNFDPAVFLMPLSFAAQAGGSLTLMGSSINFVARQVFETSTQGVYVLGFCDLTLGGFVLVLINGVYCALVGPRLLSKKDADLTTERADIARELSGSDTPSIGAPANVYKVEFLVTPDGPLVGQNFHETGLQRITGVYSIHVARACKETFKRGAVSNADVLPTTEVVHEPESHAGTSSPKLASDDAIHAQVTAEGVAALRSVRGLELANEQTEVVKLGAGRRERCLMEAVISSHLVNTKLSVHQMLRDTRCAVVSVRSNQRLPWLQTFNGYIMQQGDVLLLEAFKDSLGTDMFVRTFGVVRAVPNSAPQRTGRAPDTLRAICTALGLAMVIGSSMIGSKKFSLEVCCALLLCFLFFIKAMTIKDAYSHVNVAVLLTIIGALALGAAVQDTGLARFLAHLIIQATASWGQMAVLAGLYLAAAILGLFVTNAAVVAILGEIGTSVATEINLPIQAVALVIVYASSACWCSPFSYQTNLMVMPVASYSWGDFLKFGVPLQFLHMIVTVIVVPFCATWIQ